jgi:hypothetical protein
MMQDRQRERRGLAGAGLRYPDHVPARQRQGNGPGLNRRWRNVFLFGKGTCNRLGKAEIMKREQ